MAGGKSKRINESGLAAVKILCKGIVQGVGFRPFVYNLALKLGITGWVLNSTRGLEIHAEGSPKQVGEFVRQLKANPPRLARITGFSTQKVEPGGFDDFTINLSASREETDVLVPPDTATCEACRREVFDPDDRHYLYPFTNCTNCGPRFTIVKDFPYDRSNTTMQEFPMCSGCEEEYNDPADRRFHAQPVACPECGPQVWMEDNTGARIPGDWRSEFVQAIASGAIVAVKGLGGFHLACNALSSKAVAELRNKKDRPFKPLAVMARDLDVVKKYCRVSEKEEALLAGPEAPIVVLDKLADCGLPENLAPHLQTLGVMLPYTPLHLLLFGGGLELLVMTSGNPSGLPLEKDNDEARLSLGPAVDYFLMHNREIENRTDDSVVRFVDGHLQFLRRSRGYVPRPIDIPVDSRHPAAVLGIGGEMKNTFCIVKPDGEAYMGQHMGELETVEAINNLKDGLDKFQRFLEVSPELAAYDMHPGYNSSRVGREFPAEKRYAVQHHHAHMAACMAENGIRKPVIGVILDGTGYGLDGKIWGCEFLTGNYEGFTREGHLKYISLIGGERAVREPWLLSLAYLKECMGDEGIQLARERFARDAEIDRALKMLDNGLNCPPASSAGRLFDAVSALLGVCTRETYEGQPAIELGELVRGTCSSASYGSMYEQSAARPFVLNPTRIFVGLAEDLEAGTRTEDAAVKFHNSFVETITGAVEEIRRTTGINGVVLSGGVFHNEYLLRRTRQSLEDRDFEVHFHHDVPPGDGGIALGQAATAYWRWVADVSINAVESD